MLCPSWKKKQQQKQTKNKKKLPSCWRTWRSGEKICESPTPPPLAHQLLSSGNLRQIEKRVWASGKSCTNITSNDGNPFKTVARHWNITSLSPLPTCSLRHKIEWDTIPLPHPQFASMTGNDCYKIALKMIDYRCSMTTQTIRRPEVTFHLSLVSLGKVKKKKKEHNSARYEWHWWKFYCIKM